MPFIQDKSLMRYVVAKIMWRPAHNPVGMNGTMTRDAT
jgi:hypothetical protein